MGSAEDLHIYSSSSGTQFKKKLMFLILAVNAAPQVIPQSPLPPDRSSSRSLLRGSVSDPGGWRAVSAI